MKIIEKKPVPMYESTCPECKSVFRYKKIEVCWSHITCPVCGVSMWASLNPVEMEEEQTDSQESKYYCLNKNNN